MTKEHNTTLTESTGRRSFSRVDCSSAEKGGGGQSCTRTCEEIVNAKGNQSRHYGDKLLLKLPLRKKREKKGEVWGG